MSRGAIPRTTPLAFRLLVSMLIGIHGWYRLLHGGSPPFGDWLASQGIPLPHAIAWSITIGEIIGSACLAIGVCVRPFALLFIAVYTMGVILIHLAEGWFVVGAGRNGMEYSVLLIGSLALIAVAIRDPLWRPRAREH
ncbi:MAG: DoxX family protein [Xanthomonadales bacterium]|nr:DoxX family protein [Xanthomonadales bacterium]